MHCLSGAKKNYLSSVNAKNKKKNGEEQLDLKKGEF